MLHISWTPIRATQRALYILIKWLLELLCHVLWTMRLILKCRFGVRVLDEEAEINIRIAKAAAVMQIQYNAMQCNTTQHNTTQRNATQRNATQRNATQRNASSMYVLEDQHYFLKVKR